MNKTPEDAAYIALGRMLDCGSPEIVKLAHTALSDVLRLRESCQKNLRAAQRLTLLAGGVLLCSLIVLIESLLL